MNAVRSEMELRELEIKLGKVTAFICEFGSDDECQNKDFDFACNVHDAICWVLGEIPTEDFRSDCYLNVAKLQTIVKKIEDRTEQKLE